MPAATHAHTRTQVHEIEFRSTNDCTLAARVVNHVNRKLHDGMRATGRFVELGGSHGAVLRALRSCHAHTTAHRQ
jgi:hypothetical protein